MPRDWVANPPQTKKEYEQRLREASTRQVQQRRQARAQQQQVFQQMEQARQQAQQANLQRYQDILGGYGNLMQQYGLATMNIPQQFSDVSAGYTARTQQLSDLLRGFGDVQRTNLEEARKRRLSQVEQQLVRRGLTGTTVYEDALRGIESDYQRGVRELNDQLTRQQMGYLSQLTGEELSAKGQIPSQLLGAAGQAFGIAERPLQFMERRTDVGPSMGDVSQYAQLTGAGLAGKPEYYRSLMLNDPRRQTTLSKVGQVAGMLFG